MENVRKISKKYYLRQIICCWLVFYMLFCFGMPVQVVMADLTPPANALPSGIIDSTGINTPVISGLNMDITQTLGEAIINWNNFDIGSDAGVEFFQPGSAAAVLNRVHDGDVTGIMGSLTANGRVFVINPAGIVFGEGAVVNVSQLVASSLKLDDDDFLNGAPYQFTGGSGMVANYGQISAEQVALIGRKVLNDGVIQAPAGTVVMAAGDKVFLGYEGSDVVVEVTGITLPEATDAAFGNGDVINEGTIEAAGGKIILAAGDTFSRAIEGLDSRTVAVESGTGRVGQFGTLSVDGVEGDGGSITLTAGDVVALGSDSITTANAGTNGDGGEVIVYSPEMALFRPGALVEAKGGSESGDGGFFEISGHEYVEVVGQIDLTAPYGAKGNFLIDPRNVKITDGEWAWINPNPNQGWADWNGGEGRWDPWHPGWSTPFSGNNYSILDIDWLEYYLYKSDVTITTDPLFYDPGQAGWVWFDAGRDVVSERNWGYLWQLLLGVPAHTTSDNSLVVNANAFIQFMPDSGIDFAGSGNVTLNAGSYIDIDAGINPDSVGIYLNGGHFTADAGDGSKIYIARDIQAGNITLKDDVILNGTGSCINQLLDAGGGTLVAWEDVDKTTCGDLTLRGAGGIYLGDDVRTYNGNLTFDNAVIANGCGEQVFDADGQYKNLHAKGSITKTKSGDLILDGGYDVDGIYRINLDGDVRLTAEDSLLPCGSLYIGNGAGGPDNATVAPSKTLMAVDDVVVYDKLYGEGDLTVEAGDNIVFGDDVDVEGSLVARAGLDIASSLCPSSGEGFIEAAGDITAADMLLTAGWGWPGYEVSTPTQTYVHVAGMLTSTAGDITVGAQHDIVLGGADDDGTWTSVDAAGNLTLDGDWHSPLYGDGYKGGDVTVDGAINTGGSTNAYGNNITLGGDVQAGGDIILTADTSSDFANPLPEGDVTASGNLTSIGGSVEIYSDGDTTYLGGDVTAAVDVLLNNDTEFTSTDDQHVTAQTGSVTANGYLEKPEDGSLYLLANDNISLADHVLVENGGISIIAETGKIFTPGAGGGDDTLNVDITGTSDHVLGIGVDLPKDYDQPAPDAAGEYEIGKAAIVIMSEKALKLGPDGVLTAKGTYYTYDDDVFVDDRPGVDFANYDRPGKPGGDPIDVAIYLASNSREPIDLPIFDYEGDVYVGSPVADLPDGAVMVVDAYDMVTFGDAFETSLDDGNVDWLEVCSRISPTYEFAWAYAKLPKSAGKGWDLDNYVWRGEDGGDDGGAWVLIPAPTAPLAQFQVPTIEGCPVETQAAAMELGITAETIQVGIGKALALNPTIQPCQACAALVDAASILRDEDGSRMAAMVQTFNVLAPADAPFTPEMATSIAMAFEGAAEGTQYASVMEYIDAFVQYVAVLDIELGSPIGDDSVAFVMEKYGAGITASDNANMAAFVAAQLEAFGG